MTNRFLGIALAIITMTTNAQNEIDALRYSTHNLNGTARYTAMGGAFSSLGAEFSALSQNPAGIGMYQFSEITFTPSFNLWHQFLCLSPQSVNLVIPTLKQFRQAQALQNLRPYQNFGFYGSPLANKRKTDPEYQLTNF